MIKNKPQVVQTKVSSTLESNHEENPNVICSLGTFGITSIIPSHIQPNSRVIAIVHTAERNGIVFFKKKTSKHEDRDVAEFEETVSQLHEICDLNGYEIAVLEDGYYIMNRGAIMEVP